MTAGLRSDGLVRVRSATGECGSPELEITVQDGWYLFAPGSGEGLPLRVTCGDEDIAFHVAGADGLDGKLGGRFVVSLAGPVRRELAVHVQACNGDQCLRPSVLPVRVDPS